jgi:hypothetical protein
MKWRRKQGNPHTQPLKFMMFWVLCESHQQYSSCDKLYIGEFDKLTLQVVPTIQVHAKSTMRISYFIFISNFRLGLIFRVYI